MMKQRISYLIKLFLAFLLFFVLQKIVFVYLNAPLPVGDLFQVIVHGWAWTLLQRDTCSSSHSSSYGSAFGCVA